MSAGFLLDTNVVSELARRHVEPRVESWVASQEFGALWMSVVTIGEMEKGFCLMADTQRRTRLEAWLEQKLAELFREQVLPVTRQIARQWGSFDALRQQAGRPLPMPDGLIAATAAEHDLVVVTRNTKDFEGLGLQLVNPWTELSSPRSLK